MFRLQLSEVINYVNEMEVRAGIVPSETPDEPACTQAAAETISRVISAFVDLADQHEKGTHGLS